MIGKAFAPLATVLLLQLKTVHSAESAYDHAHVFHEEELQSDVCMLQLSATLHKPDQESGLAHEPHHALVRASPCQNSTMNGSLKSASTVPRVMGAKDQYATRKHKQGEDKQNVTSLKSIPMSGKVVRPVKVMHSMLQQEPAEGEAAPAPAGEATPASEGEAAPAPAAPAPAEGEAAPAPAEGEATAPAPAGETTPAAEGEAAPAPAGEATAPAPEGETTGEATATAPAGEATAPTEGEAAAPAEGTAAAPTGGEVAAPAEGEAAAPAEGEAAAPAEGEAAAVAEGEPAAAAAAEGEAAPAAEGEAAASEGEAAAAEGEGAKAPEEELAANAAPPVPERPDVSNEGPTNEDKFAEHFASINNEVKEARIVSCVLLSLIAVFMVVHVMHEYDIHVLPEGVMIILVGIMLGLVLKYWCESRMMYDPEYRSEIAIQMLNELFLPMLMLEAGWSVRRMDFISQLPYILNFAVFGTLISTAVIAGLIYKTGELGMHQITTLRGATIIASLISATDPVSTLGTYSDLRVDPLLNIIVFGEAAINDAVAIVVFSLVNDDYYMENITSTSSMIFTGIGKGSRTLTCSFLLGGATCLAVCGCLRLVGMHRNKKLEILVVVLGGYLSYAIGEYFRVSGIICTLFNGMFLGKYAKFHLSVEGTMLTSFFISQMSTIMDSGVFLLSGVCCISLSTAGRSLGVYLMIFCAIARVCSTIPCGLVSNFMKWTINRNPNATDDDLHILTSKYLFMIWHAGLRGGIAENLALQIGEWLDNTNGPGSKEAVRSAVFFLVATFIIVFGGTTKMFLQCFGIPMGSSYSEDALSKTELNHTQGRLINFLHNKFFFPLLVGTSVSSQDADVVQDVGDNDVLEVLHEVCHGHRGGCMRKRDLEVPDVPDIDETKIKR